MNIGYRNRSNAWAITVAVSVAALLGGCYAGNSDGGASGQETEGADGGVDDADDGADDGADDDGGGGDPLARCEESKIGPPMLRRLTRHELEQTVRVVFPEIESAFEGVALGPDTVSSLGFGNDADVLFVSEQVAAEILQTAEDVADLVTADGQLAAVLPCASVGADTSCATEFIEAYGERLFRRPLTAAERDEFVGLFDSVAGQADFRTGLKWTLVSLLQSPHVVYRSELGEGGEGQMRTLADWELATALAYNFSGGPPSAQLRALADDGGLDDPQVRVEQARQLLASASGQETLDRFFLDWLDYSRVTTQTRPEVDAFESVRDAMVEETRQFIRTVVVQDEGDVASLLLSDYTAVDTTLAQYYGFDAAPGQDEGFAVVPRPDEYSVGLLSQGSVLASNAHADASSPTRRGLLVYERLLCLPRPPLPDDIPAIDPPSPGSTTTRERYEQQHMANDGCRSCHVLFDPIGFAFEHFDAAGRFRADESGLEIDATGLIPKGPVSEEVAFDGLTELSETLAAQPEVTDCVSGLAASYVFGGAGGTSCLAEQARTDLADSEYGLAEYVAQLAAAPHFTQRQ